MTARVAALTLALALGCAQSPTLDTEVVAHVPEQSCCCGVPTGDLTVYEALGTDVCTSAGGSCAEEQSCEDFALEPCCCVFLRNDKRRAEPSTWGECLDPGTCHPGSCERFQ